MALSTESAEPLWPVFYNVKAVAKVLTVSKMTVYRLIQTGEIKASRFGREFRVSHDALTEYLGTSELKNGSNNEQ
jgi:excisionase family DNA binding protein